MGIERMVGYVLPETLSVHVKIECLRKRLPFVHALECHKVVAVETFYYLEIVADIIVGELRRLTVRY